jgi:hypothetical protein
LENQRPDVPGGQLADRANVIIPDLPGVCSIFGSGLRILWLCGSNSLSFWFF